MQPIEAVSAYTAYLFMVMRAGISGPAMVRIADHDLDKVLNAYV